MNVAYEDRKLHDDGIFRSSMGYKEWFHYQATLFVEGEPLTFVLGFPRSYLGMSALGWISLKKNQYPLVGSKKVNEIHMLQRIPLSFTPHPDHYVVTYTDDLEPGHHYAGTVTGKYPHCTLDIEAPDVDIKVNMIISRPDTSAGTSVAQREIFESMPCGQRFASWFHSADIQTTLKGTIQGHDVTTSDSRNRGWYERMWSKVMVLGPSEWFWVLLHLDDGSAFNLLIEETLGIRIPVLDECWHYRDGTFTAFSCYNRHYSASLRKKLKKDEVASAVGDYIICEGKDGGNSFEVKATITDARVYGYKAPGVDVTWTNLVLESEGEAVINGKNVDMKGRGVAERAYMRYWWL